MQFKNTFIQFKNNFIQFKNTFIKFNNAVLLISTLMKFYVISNMSENQSVAHCKCSLN